MSDKVATICLSRNQAAFLQVNLSQLATTTRQAMARPRLEPERHLALGSRAFVLEKIEDAVRSAMLDVPNTTRKSARSVEAVAHPGAQRQVQEFGRSFAGTMAHPAVVSLQVI
jgi:hypothetical protein